MTFGNRDVDIVVASRVLGFHHYIIHVDWYRLPIHLFSTGEGEKEESIYTFDSHSCNAMLFRNGKDDHNGCVPPLPFFSTDLHLAFGEIVPAMQKKDLFDEFKQQVGEFLHLTTEEAAMRLCTAALIVVGAFEEVQACPSSFQSLP